MPGDSGNALRRLKACGVSPWYDNIGRRLIANGYLNKIFENGILGVTSNPTIFEKAISSSCDYDSRIAELMRQGLDIRAIYDELTSWDIREASDLLAGIYKSSNYTDGYVSIEVLPEYANDPLKTVDYARYIFKKVGRPNIMIKVPATAESPQAIRTLIREGINVNITLIFSVEHYQRAACAYIEGLKDRIKENKGQGRVNSVASVFVSRIDTAVDKILDNPDKISPDRNILPEAESLKGKAAIANCKMIYQRFKELFYNDDFVRLQEKGARRQRVLWASTGTKNALYSDVKYVDGLVAQETVNTIPQATLDAYLDHGHPGPCICTEDSFKEARLFLKRLSALGIDVNKVCQELQDEGVGLFAASYNKLLSSLKNKMFTVQTGQGTDLKLRGCH